VVKVIGIDLAGSEARPTGLALIEDRFISCTTLYSDGELISYCCKRGADLIAIDAPLTFPSKGAMREVDRAMHKLGLRVLPPLFPGMVKLTKRGMKLSRRLKDVGFKVIEVHPHSTVRRLGLANRFKLLQELEDEGYLLLNDVSNVHEVDAIIAAYTGVLYLNGLAEEVGGEDGVIIVPKPL